MEREAPSFFESVCLLTFLKGFSPTWSPKPFQNWLQVAQKSSPNVFGSASYSPGKIDPQAFKINPKNLRKSTLKRSKIHPKTLQNRDLEGIALRIALDPFFFPHFGVSWAVWRASWGRLGAVLGCLGATLGCLAVS